MVKKEQYFEYLYQVMYFNKLIPDSNLWRNNLEYAVSYLNIDISFIRRLREQYAAEFSETILINSSKNILLCKSIQNPISKELCAISVYFSLLGCLLDFWLDSGIDILQKKGIQKLSWNNCKRYFLEFCSEKYFDDIADELFQIVGNGMHTISIENPKLYKYLLELIRKAVLSEVAVTIKNKDVEDNLIYNKSVLFIEIALLIAIGNKTDINEDDFSALRKIGFLYAYIDDIIDIYDDIESNQGNVFVNRILSGESYKTVIDTCIIRLNELIYEIRKYFGNEFAEFLLNEISEWAFTNRYLMRIIYEG